MLKVNINNFKIFISFLNRLLPDISVIELMFIVHVEKIWVKIAKKILRCGRPGGGGGVASDFGHPRTRGEGRQKRANFCGRPLWMAPKLMINVILVIPNLSYVST